VIAGVDVGLAGAVCFIKPRHPESAEALDLPVYVLAHGGRAKPELDIAGLIRVLVRRRLTHPFVEQLGAMPGQGVSGIFALPQPGLPKTIAGMEKRRRQLLATMRQGCLRRTHGSDARILAR
jgi:hypothetical protein